MALRLAIELKSFEGAMDMAPKQKETITKKTKVKDRPYIQTERKEIYHAFAKYLVSIGRAYPCFCTEQELNDLREHQEHKKEITGYYGRYARCRSLTYEQIEEKINNGEKNEKIWFILISLFLLR